MLRQFIRSSPTLYFAWMRIRNDRRGQEIVHAETDLVIEAFPRSGNTFAVVGMLIANGTNFKLAHHTHAPAQIIRATQFGIPAIVLLRNPIDCISSLLIRNPNLDPISSLKDYISFYDSIVHNRNQLALLPVSDLFSNFSTLPKLINKKFGTKFNEENLDKELIWAKIREINSTFEGADASKIAIPDESKNKKKQIVIENLSRSKFTGLLFRAERLYERALRTVESVQS